MHSFRVDRTKNGFAVCVATDLGYDEYVFETRAKLNKAYKAWLDAVAPKQKKQPEQMELEIG